MTPDDRSAREQFAAAFQRETEITIRVLRAYPDEALDLKPHPKLKSARDLAWLLVREQSMLQTALGPGFDWSKKQEPFPRRRTRCARSPTRSRPGCTSPSRRCGRATTTSCNAR